MDAGKKENSLLDSISQYNGFQLGNLLINQLFKLNAAFPHFYVFDIFSEYHFRSKFFNLQPSSLTKIVARSWKGLWIQGARGKTPAGILSVCRGCFLSATQQTQCLPASQQIACEICGLDPGQAGCLLCRKCPLAEVPYFHMCLNQDTYTTCLPCIYQLQYQLYFRD